MDGIFSAYLLTLGVITYRWVSGPKQPPPPIAFLGATVIFGGTAIIGNANKNLGTALAWAFLMGALVAPKTNIQAVARLAGAPSNDGGPGYGGSYKNGHIAGSAPNNPTTPDVPLDPGQTYDPNKYKNPDAPGYDPFKKHPITGA